MSGKKKHTAFCTSKYKDTPPGDAGSDAAPQKGRGGRVDPFGRCAYPGCTFMVNSDSSISPGYCCPKCEALHAGEPWAENGKRHYKCCERREFAPGSSGRGGGPYSMDPMAEMAEFFTAMMWKKGGMLGDKGYGKGGKDWGSGNHSGKSGQGSGMKSNYTSSQKVWIGNLPEGLSRDDLWGHCSGLGVAPKAVNVKGTTAMLAFASEREVPDAIVLLGGTEIGGQVLEVDVWTTNW